MAATNTADNEIRTETIKHDEQRLEKLRTAIIIFCLFCGGNGAMMYKTVLWEPDLVAVYSIWMENCKRYKISGPPSHTFLMRMKKPQSATTTTSTVFAVDVIPNIAHLNWFMCLARATWWGRWWRRKKWSQRINKTQPNVSCSANSNKTHGIISQTATHLSGFNSARSNLLFASIEFFSTIFRFRCSGIGGNMLIKFCLPYLRLILRRFQVIPYLLKNKINWPGHWRV